MDNYFEELERAEELEEQRLYEEYRNVEDSNIEEHCKYCGARKKIGYLCMECGRV